MKVFDITTLAKPPKGRFPNYCTLGCRQADRSSIQTKFFLGKPYPATWMPIQLFVAEPKFPRPDFYSLGVGEFVCNARALELAGEALEMSGELLPVTVEDEFGEFFVFNVTNCLNVIDKQKSAWRSLDAAGTYRELSSKAFHSERFGEATIFKIPEDGGVGIYCVERTGDPEDGEFKALVEYHNLTGLEFKLIWTDESS